MRRGRKGSFFQSPFDNFRENRNRSFYNFPATCRKRISIIRVRKVLFSPWSYHNLIIYYLSMYVFLYVFQSPFDNFRENRNRSFYNFPATCRKRISIIRVRKVLFSPWSYHNLIIYYLSMYVFLHGNNFIPLSYKRKNRNLEEIT